MMALSGVDICIFFAAFSIAIDIFLFLFFLFKKKEYHYHTKDLPFVSILVAARDEEENIVSCIESLLNLNYPKEKIEILIGNDKSSDQTFNIIQKYANIHQHIHAINITNNLGNAKAKANVLAQLANTAHGAYFFITDSDTQVPSGWVKALLPALKEGLAMGVTIPTGKGLFANLQTIDWLYHLGLFKIMSDMKLPVTLMGNNMAISKKAYQSTGGYENMPPSIVEDFTLFKHASQKGFLLNYIFDDKVRAFTKSQPSILSLIAQRLRWLQGALHISIKQKLFFILRKFLFISLLVLSVKDISVFLLFFLSRSLIKSTFIVMLFKKVKVKYNYFLIPFYDFYSIVLNLVLVFCYIFTKSTKWKSRNYSLR